MTEANHYVECGCVLNADGRLIQACPDCAKAALRERTYGPALPAGFIRRLIDAVNDTVRLPRCL